MTRGVLLALVLVGCRQLPQDPDVTGVAIWPDAGTVDGPTDLIVVNRRAQPVRCDVRVYEVGCPVPQAFLDDLAELAPRERLVLTEESCLTVDVTCLPEGADATTPPLRTWSWEVLPAPIEDDDDEDDVAFDEAGTG